MKSIKDYLKKYSPEQIARNKYYHDEFDAYRAKFYPTESEIKNSDPDLVKANFKKAWTHHYKTNRHHPEYFVEFHSTIDTDPVALMEMLCDWKASSERQKDGNLLKSIEINAARFEYDDQLKQIFINTAKLFDEHEV